VFTNIESYFNHVLRQNSEPGVGKVRPSGRIRPFRRVCAAF